MANLLNRNNKHLFLEKPDKSPNSFVANMNSLAKSFRGLTSEEVLALKDIPATIVSLGEEWKLILEETALDLLAGASAFNTAIVTKITEDVPANSEIVLPDIAKYVVGTNMLMLSYNGTVCYLGEQFEEVGEPHTDSNKIKILFDLRTDDVLEFRIVALNANVSNSAVIAEGSTEPRALSERFSDIINVKDFGAKGDGVTDDTAAINAAFAAAKERNADVFFPAGTYNAVGVITLLNEVRTVGDGILKRGSTLYYVNNPRTHRNFIYCSPAGGGDGLSVDQPTTVNNAVKRLKLWPMLSGLWTVKLAAGTYKTGEQFNGLHCEAAHHLVFEGEAVDTKGTDDKTQWEWKTIFEPYSEAAYANILYFGQCNYITVRNIWCSHKNTLTNGTGMAFSYGSTSAYVDTCKVTGASWSGIIFQAIGFGTVYNSLIDGDGVGDAIGTGRGRCKYAINWYNTFGNTNSSGKTRNLIQNYSNGVFGQGGRAYIHNDYNDFNNCGYAFGGDFNCHCEDNYNTVTNCTYTQMLRFDSVGTCPTLTGGGSRIATFGKLSVSDSSPDFAYIPGVFYYSLGTRGRKSLFEKAIQSVFGRLTINLGDEDAPSTLKAKVSSPLTLYDTTAAHCNVSMAGRQSCAINFYATEDSSDGAVLAGDKLGFVQSRSNGIFLGIGTEQYYRAAVTGFTPIKDNTVNLGGPAYRWMEVFAATGAINTSDARLKTAITSPDDALMRAWGKVNFKAFQFMDAVEKKGENARIHFGVIAQQVAEAFASEGLDASRYALFCYDKWEDEYEAVEVVDKEEVIDEDTGTVVQERETHTETRLVRKAGDSYGIRYSEALALECAYQRWLGEKREQRIAALEAKLGEINV